MHATTHHADLLDLGISLLDLRRRLNETGKSLHAAIMASIADGKQTRKAIIYIVMGLVGHRFAQVARVLDAGTGNNPSSNDWYCDQMQRYHLHAKLDLYPRNYTSGFKDDFADDVPF